MVLETGDNDTNAMVADDIFREENILILQKYGKNILLVNRVTNNYQKSTNVPLKRYKEKSIHIR